MACFLFSRAPLVLACFRVARLVTASGTYRPCCLTLVDGLFTRGMGGFSEGDTSMPAR